MGPLLASLVGVGLRLPPTEDGRSSSPLSFRPCPVSDSAASSGYSIAKSVTHQARRRRRLKGMGGCRDSKQSSCLYCAFTYVWARGLLGGGGLLDSLAGLCSGAQRRLKGD